MIYDIPSLSLCWCCCCKLYKIERESESVGTAIVRSIRILKAYLDQDRSTIQKHDVNVNLIFLLLFCLFGILEHSLGCWMIEIQLHIYKVCV